MILRFVSRLLPPALRYPLRQIWWQFAPLPPPNDVWRMRTAKAVNAPENADIPRHPRAGQCRGRWIVMHNGTEVLARGYYGAGMTHLLQKNRGVHEPQEERIFQDILRHLPENAVMLELGAYWGFYSLWFLQRVPQGRAVLIEPDPDHLRIARSNFRHNRQRATFLCAAVGSEPKSAKASPVRVLDVDEIADVCRLPRIDILHADIQGAEEKMLDGCRDMAAKGRIGCIFLSTHSAELHRNCLEKVRSWGFAVPAEIPPANSASVDGLIVAGVPGFAGIPCGD